MKRLLAVCLPTFNNQLHTNARNDALVLATDEILVGMMDRGWDVDVVSLCDPQGYPLMRSRLHPRTPADVDPAAYDLIYHAFRDPTQPEVYDRLRQLGWLALQTPTLNHAARLRQHHKKAYFKILNAFGIGPRIYDDVPRGVSWGKTEHGATPSTDRKYIQTWGINNNRGNYPERRAYEVIISEYIDNAAGGVRSFFRIGYALGRCCRGWLYASHDDLAVQKSGNAKHKVPFAMPRSYEEVVEHALTEMGVDLAHIEGCFVGEKLYLFDINPFPTTYGATLKATTEAMCDRIDQGFQEGHLTTDTQATTSMSMVSPVAAQPVADRAKGAEPADAEQRARPQPGDIQQSASVDLVLPSQNGRSLPPLITPPDDLYFDEDGFDQVLTQAMPMMTREEAYYIRWFLAHLNPERVLEYGAGNSTRVFAPFVPSWTTVEHNQEWADKIGQAMPGVRMICKTHADETYFLEETIEAYCCPVELNGGDFDLVFIDGDYRYQCIERLRQVLKPGGIALVHDTRRPGYWGRKGPMQYMYHLTAGEINTHHDPHQGLALLTDTEWEDWDSWLFSR